MLFLLIRLFPIFLPVVYYLTMKGFFIWPEKWPYLLAGVVILNWIFFILLNRKLKRRRTWFFAGYATIFTTMGFVYAALLSSVLIINLFLVVWSLVYLVYLEAVFNYLYRTERFFILELKSITAYINLAIFFLLSYSLLAYRVLFDLPLWGVFLAFIPITGVIIYNRFLSFAVPHKANIVYSGVLTLILTEVMAIIIWWSNSSYVLAFILLIVYYLLSSVGVSFYDGKLTKKIILQYIVLSAVATFLVLVTAQWV